MATLQTKGVRGAARSDCHSGLWAGPHAAGRPKRGIWNHAAATHFTSFLASPHTLPETTGKPRGSWCVNNLSHTWCYNCLTCPSGGVGRNGRGTKNMLQWWLVLLSSKPTPFGKKIICKYNSSAKWRWPASSSAGALLEAPHFQPLTTRDTVAIGG